MPISAHLQQRLPVPLYRVVRAGKAFAPRTCVQTGSGSTSVGRVHPDYCLSSSQHMKSHSRLCRAHVVEQRTIPRISDCTSPCMQTHRLVPDFTHSSASYIMHVIKPSAVRQLSNAGATGWSRNTMPDKTCVVSPARVNVNSAHSVKEASPLSACAGILKGFLRRCLASAA